VDIETQNLQTVQCKLLTDYGKTVEDSIQHSYTITTDGKL